MLRFLLFNGLFAGCTLYALTRGGAPERAVAILFAIARLSSISANAMLPPQRHFHDFNFGMAIVDIATLAALLWVAIRANRFWPMWVAALQLVEVTAHLARAYAPDIVPRGYQVSVNSWAYPMLVLLALGTWRHQARLARLGADPPWSISFGRSMAIWRRGGPRR